MIPIKAFDYNVTKPGFIEADTVAHCGNSLEGQFAWTLTFTDIHSGWTNNRATWGKGSIGVVDGIKDIEKELPFEMYAFNSDNGSEFLNNHLVDYFKSKGDKISFSRSRCYKKNDNCHVEQKNWTHVREVFGYERFDKKGIVSIMNNIYKNYQNPLMNFFVPQVKLLHKTRVGSRYVRKYSKPKTPYERIMECPDIDEKKKEELKKIKDALNPFKLRELIEANFKLVDFYLKDEENKNEEARISS